jgi:cysteine-rich repeat protein
MDFITNPNSSQILTALETIDNTNGLMSVDLGLIGGGTQQYFVGRPTIMTLNFTVVNNSAVSTQVSTHSSATLGSPDNIDLANSLPLSITLSGTYCGDGIVQTPNSAGITEVCDGGVQACTATGGYAGTQACNATCTGYLSCVASGQSCGDGVVNGDEVCDDGNTTNNDLCSASCGNACTYPLKWNGSACVCPQSTFTCPDGDVISADPLDSCSFTSCPADTRPAACKTDYDNNGTIALPDFALFATHYGCARLLCTIAPPNLYTNKGQVRSWPCSILITYLILTL